MEPIKYTDVCQNKTCKQLNILEKIDKTPDDLFLKNCLFPFRRNSFRVPRKVLADIAQFNDLFFTFDLVKLFDDNYALALFLSIHFHFPTTIKYSRSEPQKTLSNTKTSNDVKKLKNKCFFENILLVIEA